MVHRKWKPKIQCQKIWILHKIKFFLKKGILNRNVRWLVSPLPLDPPESRCLVHLWQRGPSPAGIWNQHLCKAREHRTEDFWKHNGLTGIPLDFQQRRFWASPLFCLTQTSVSKLSANLLLDFGPFFSTAQIRSGWWLMHRFQPQPSCPQDCPDPDGDHWHGTFVGTLTVNLSVTPWHFTIEHLQ